MRGILAAAVAVMMLSACGTAGTETGTAAIEPRDGKSGLSLTGTIDGRQVAVSTGLPEMLLDDCDVNAGFDVDLCFFAADLDGTTFGLIFENPDVLVAGTTLAVTPSACAREVCDTVTDGAVVDVQRGVGSDRVRATGGQLVVDVVEKGKRYAGRMNLLLPEGRIGGTFDVVPRPDEED